MDNQVLYMPFTDFTVELADLSTIALEHLDAHTLGGRGAFNRPTFTQRYRRRAMGAFSRGD